MGPMRFITAGIRCRGAGDVNGDGVDDLVIGAVNAGPGLFGTDTPGVAYVVFGDSGGNFGALLDPAFLAISGKGFAINGIDDGDATARTVSSAGDVNGDGVDDLLIAADNASVTGTAASYVVFGDSGFDGTPFELSSIDGSNGFVINNITSIDADARTNESVSCAGDVNGDGMDDLVIGAFFAAPNGNYSAGESYVVFGRDVSTPDLPCADQNGDGNILPDDFSAFLANLSVGDPAADVNRDGFVLADDFSAWVTAFNAGIASGATCAP